MNFQNDTKIQHAIIGTDKGITVFLGQIYCN